MRGFATGLGVRCQYCHAARAGQEIEAMDLTTFDFASDANPMKEKARTMMKMVRAINETHLSELDVPVSERLEVSCITCHHGLEKPRQLADVLAGVLDADGVEAAVQTYHQLRERHYGSSAYSFRPGILGGLGERLMGAGRIEAAIEILALENAQNPNFAYGHYLSATAYEKAGEREAALEHMQIAVDTAPSDQKPFFTRSLEELKQ
jgi:tetratricopeptide (TPR) repeat protein